MSLSKIHWGFVGNWICQIVLIVEHVITNLLLNCYNKFVIILGKGT